ncbi:MAG: YqaA family protein [Akkermansiaceae bacterium]|nr:YqaA family protein [Akkermansiaceae bacterium]
MLELLDSYLWLFVIAFLAATLVPAYSEILLVSMAAMGRDPLMLLLVATTGNTLGSAVNWWLGRFLLHYQHRRWFPFKEDKLGLAQRWFQKYGVWSLLMAWAPIGGDALTFIAGMMKVRFAIFLALTGIGKAVRYALVLGIADQVMPFF